MCFFSVSLLPTHYNQHTENWLSISLLCENILTYGCVCLNNACLALLVSDSIYVVSDIYYLLDLFFPLNIFQRFIHGVA